MYSNVTQKAMGKYLQISQGKSVWGRETEPRIVLYFSLEDTLGRLQERLYQLVDAEEDPERLILQTESNGIGQGLEERIVSFIHAYPDISLIVIDTLQKVRKTERNGSMYANDYRDIGALKELADKYGICILLVHHLRKQSSSDPYDQISSSTGIMGVADTTWLMHRQQTMNETVSEDDYLFRQPNGKPMCPSTFTYRFKLILKANNLPLNLSVHSLRHTNASLLIAQGVDVRTVASLLGHAQASTTLDIYAHAFDKNKRKAQEKLGKAIGL